MANAVRRCYNTDTPGNIRKRRQVGNGLVVDTSKMDNVKEYSTPVEKPFDLYEEFARLCGAPADMDRDGQIELFGQYQRDFDEMKEALFKDKTYEEQEELANTFIADWVANTKAKMADRKKKPTAPPEAYAAFVRIYLEWMERDEEEKIALVERSVNNAAREHRKFVPNIGYSQFLLKKGFTTMYGADFDEYVNEVWAIFLENCADVDSFAVYLQKDFEKAAREYDKMRDSFLDDVFKEWNSVTVGMSNQQLDKFFKSELVKRMKEFEAKKDNFEKRHSGYPKLTKLLRRPAQNMMGRLYREQRKASRGISLDADDINTDTKPEIEDKTEHGLLVEEDLVVRDYIERVKKKLDKMDEKILDDIISGASQTEIADELGVSNAAVSKRMKKIRAIMQDMIQ